MARKLTENTTHPRGDSNNSSLKHELAEHYRRQAYNPALSEVSRRFALRRLAALNTEEVAQDESNS
ncbi:hypothetical protein [Pseudanabaena sp. PCC 6802]|uniref:hypothetical protein n=1 Tax=Pseudanabaena sp. PCC 6802 TaxID=118173 RepID=UPI0003468232|nr:hypothetical protein [Pseudanabaena sp. PCC 6802]